MLKYGKPWGKPFSFSLTAWNFFFLYGYSVGVGGGKPDYEVRGSSNKNTCSPRFRPPAMRSLNCSGKLEAFNGRFLPKALVNSFSFR